MDDAEFDRALIAAAFALAGRDGWHSVGVAAAAREAGLPLQQARARFAGRDAILMRFGRLADQAALTGVPGEASAREKLFDMLMRRFDALQEHRAGVQALLRALPAHPALALRLGAATVRSMVWMLEGAGLSGTGLAGALRAKGLTAVWMYALRVWDRDDSAELAATMAALDRALTRAEALGQRLEGGQAPPGPQPFPEHPPPVADAPA